MQDRLHSSRPDCLQTCIERDQDDCASEQWRLHVHLPFCLMHCCTWNTIGLLHPALASSTWVPTYIHQSTNRTRITHAELTTVAHYCNCFYRITSLATATPPNGHLMPGAISCGLAAAGRRQGRSVSLVSSLLTARKDTSPGLQVQRRMQSAMHREFASQIHSDLVLTVQSTSGSAVLSMRCPPVSPLPQECTY